MIITNQIEVSINYPDQNCNFPEELIYDYCDFGAQVEKVYQMLKKLSSGPLKFTNNEWQQITESILESFSK